MSIVLSVGQLDAMRAFLASEKLVVSEETLAAWPVVLAIVEGPAAGPKAVLHLPAHGVEDILLRDQKQLESLVDAVGAAATRAVREVADGGAMTQREVPAAFTYATRPPSLGGIVTTASVRRVGGYQAPAVEKKKPEDKKTG